MNNCLLSEYHRQKTAQPSEDVSVKIGAGQTSIANINDDNAGKPKFIKVSFSRKRMLGLLLFLRL